MSRQPAASPSRPLISLARVFASAFSCTFTSALVLVVTGAFAFPAAAADEEKKVDPAMRAAVEQFLVVQNTPQIMAEQMTYSVAEQTLDAIAAGGVTITEPMQNLVLEESRREFGTRFGDIKFLTDLHAPIYAEYFTAEEILEIVAFYETPSGQKLMSTSPAVNQAFYGKLQEETITMIPAFQGRVDARLRASGMLSDMSMNPTAP